MADSDEKAEEMITDLETIIRERLGDHIFGTDARSLEMSALENVTQSGWTVMSVENGSGNLLNQRLLKLQNPAYLGASQSVRVIDSLKKEVKFLSEAGVADVIIGLSIGIHCDDSLIHIVIHAPTMEFERQITYSGHAQTAATLGVNLTLDQLRRMPGIKTSNL